MNIEKYKAKKPEVPAYIKDPRTPDEVIEAWYLENRPVVINQQVKQNAEVPVYLYDPRTPDEVIKAWYLENRPVDINQ